MPRVSVIIPAYDAATTIVAAIDSVLDGTYHDLEVVVCDDCSHDDTARLVAAHSDPRVRLVVAAHNGGPATARNLALAAAGGELVAFLDADDRWLPRFLSEQVDHFDQSVADGRRVGIVSCDAWIVDASGTKLGRHSDIVGAGTSLTRMLLGNRVYISALCPRAAVQEAGGFSPECFGSEDHDLWLRLLEMGYELVVNPEPLALYAAGVNGISSDVAQMARTEQATYRRALARGRLSGAQRRVARAKLALAESAECRSQGRHARAVAGLAVAAIHHPAALVQALNGRRGGARSRGAPGIHNDVTSQDRESDF